MDKLRFVNGSVLESTTWSETRVSGGGNSASMSVHSSVSEKNSVFIVTEKGNERRIQLDDWNVGFRPGSNIRIAFWDNTLLGVANTDTKESAAYTTKYLKKMVNVKELGKVSGSFFGPLMVLLGILLLAVSIGLFALMDMGRDNKQLVTPFIETPHIVSVEIPDTPEWAARQKRLFGGVSSCTPTGEKSFKCVSVISKLGELDNCKKAYYAKNIFECEVDPFGNDVEFAYNDLIMAPAHLSPILGGFLIVVGFLVSVLTRSNRKNNLVNQLRQKIFQGLKA